MSTTFGNIRERAKQQLVADAPTDILIHPVQQSASNGIDSVGSAAQGWARVNSFKAKPGEVLAVPSEKGDLQGILVGLGEAKGAQLIWAYAALPGKLPAGTYSLASDGGDHANQALLGWMLGEFPNNTPSHKCIKLRCRCHKNSAWGVRRLAGCCDTSSAHEVTPLPRTPPHPTPPHPITHTHIHTYMQAATSLAATRQESWMLQVQALAAAPAAAQQQQQAAVMPSPCW